ncbi:Macrophage killing protein with similarity to conjugation protein [Legionella steigerwaltii]|uniref:Macrophage killing protein with similarity to conjugation protein n=1 Tax=Legionella steigerwaltii TaxID=460 RepID=A0A378LBJ5_9GAMM|nr:DotI/IcmL/TraM family protein [Legionella steigerwaltii]KTD78564.1 Macrophage killing protein with similarity to conjugation protein [Legionella steigerwaltii]STY24077.1 Macrophage killing protein with similarity to conjugation protein [Legionella steigerwaltii]
MKSFLGTGFLIISLLTYSNFLNADTNSQLISWVQETLTDTLSVNYTENLTDTDPVISHYSYNAWQGMVQFLGGYMDVIKEKKLTIHPVLDRNPTITQTGYSSGVPYWRVNQNVNLPELRLNVSFSLMITVPSSGSAPYIIQNLDMQKSTY